MRTRKPSVGAGSARVFGTIVAVYLNMPTDKITVRLKGKNAHPDQLRARELGVLLQDLDDALWGVIETDTAKRYERKEVYISLLAIEDNCVSLTFQANHIYAPVIAGAYKRITTAISQHDYTGIPKVARDKIEDIYSFTKRNHCTAEFLNGTKKTLAKLDPRQPLQLPSPFAAQGLTTIYAEVQRVGGVDPRIVLKLEDGPTLHCDISKELAKLLSKKLYETVSLNGEAQWDDTWNIVSFKVTGFNDQFEDIPITEAFGALSKLIGDHWNNVDPDKEIGEDRNS